MAANSGQGKSFAVFLVGLTLACAGLASWSGGMGKVLFLAGLVVTVFSLMMAKGIKSLEGKVPNRPGAGSGKFMGGVFALLGWVVTVVGIQYVTSTGGRILLGLVGIATSLFGILVILPAAFNKNAIWKT
jgi:hypothetical protein